MSTNTINAKAAEAAPPFHPDPARVGKAIAKRSYCTLATTSPAGRPHVAGVLYELVGENLYLTTLRTSRKARNVAANPHVAVNIPIRRLPAGGPPSSVQFQSDAELVSVDDPRIEGLVAAGHLKSITGHGERDLPDACFLRIALPRRVNTYGLGMSLLGLVRDPLHAGGSTELRQKLTS